MFNKYRGEFYKRYTTARNHFMKNPNQLICLENYLSIILYNLIKNNIQEIKRDYDEANYLFPFWHNYPPDDRGRQPKGDQFPWIEIGEHAIGAKLPRLLEKEFKIRDSSIPTGSDQRFVISNPKISKITSGYTNSAWLFIDIKSVGPRDDQPHTVMSHNQISGDGKWFSPGKGIQNSIIKATGTRRSHDFHCSVPPIYILSDGTIAPVVILVIKPVYRMLSLEDTKNDKGQPLGRITILSIPNGILLLKNPSYLKTYPNLFFPGKDDKEKNPLKVRCRVSFGLLQKIDKW